MISFGYGVKLGTIDSKDLELYRTWRNKYNIRKWCRQTGLIAEADQIYWYEKQVKDPTIKMYSIYGEHDLKRPVGVCGLTDICTVNSKAEFSCYIAPEHQNMGYANKSLKTLFSHGFADLNLNIIWGETFKGNKAAQLFEKLGMIKEGELRQRYYKNGTYIDSIMYSMLRFEWNLQHLHW